MHVNSGIISMIDTAYDQVRLPVEHWAQCQLDTIGRRSCTFIHSQSHFSFDQLIMNRMSHRQCTAAAGARRVGCHYNNFPQRTKELHQFTNTFSHNTIVIRNEDQRLLTFHIFNPFLFNVRTKVAKSNRTANRLSPNITLITSLSDEYTPVYKS